MKLNGLETTSTMDKITAILELIIPIMLIILILAQIGISYYRMTRIEQTQQIIILKQQDVIKNANTTADVGRNGRKEKEKLPFNNNTKINHTEQ